MNDKFVKNIPVYTKKGKALAPTNLTVANTLVAREKAVWIKEGKSLTLLFTKDDFKKLKKQIIIEEHRECYICRDIIPEEIPATIDHVNPKSKYGKDSRENLKCCCKRCNDDKGSRSIEQYYNHIVRNIEKYPYIDIQYLGEVVREMKKICS
jgi:hypothetical protein